MAVLEADFGLAAQRQPVPVVYSLGYLPRYGRKKALIKRYSADYI